MRTKIKVNENDIGKISVKLNVWPSFLDRQLSEKGELRKMKSGPDYFVWEQKSKVPLAMFNMDSPVIKNIKMRTMSKNYQKKLVVF